MQERPCGYVTDCPGCGVQRGCNTGDVECTAECGIMVSLGYPSHYPPNLYCVWLLTVDTNAYIQLTIIEFDVFENNLGPCVRDRLSFFGE